MGRPEWANFYRSLQRSIHPKGHWSAPPDKPPVADTVLIESTYGDRAHPQENILAELGPLLKKVAARGGVAVVPVFAVGRAQALLHAIALLKAQKVIPRSLPVFLDNPTAVKTTNLFDDHLGEHRLDAKEATALTHGATMVSSTDESKALASVRGARERRRVQEVA